jgi:hypothetical protein
MLPRPGTLRINHLRQRLSSRPPNETQFAIVCPKCLLTGYFHSEWAVLECRSQHTHHNAAVFVYSFLPTRHSASGFTLYEHVWIELVKSGEIELDIAG